MRLPLAQFQTAKFEVIKQGTLNFNKKITTVNSIVKAKAPIYKIKTKKNKLKLLNFKLKWYKNEK